jgi:hypothetical protein
LGRAVSDLEKEMATLGFGLGYCVAIRKKVTGGRDDAHALHIYRAALQRTLNAKVRRREKAGNPY